MPPIDPHQLLKALASLLTQKGAIKGSAECIQIANLMKKANKLVSRCVYINILRATVDDETLEKFIEVGGWDILNTWLQDCKDSDNSAVLIEMLKVYQQMPVTVDLLKKNSSAKTIKSFTKSEDEKVKNLSTDIVDKWMKKVRGGSENNNSESNVKSKKKKNDKKEKSEDKKDKKDDKKDNSKHKHHHHHKHKSDKNDSKPRSPEEDMDTSESALTAGTGTVIQGNGLKLHIKLGRPNVDNDSDSKAEKNWSRKEKNNDSNIPKRAPTVKRPNVKFRSTGLEDDVVHAPRRTRLQDESSKALSKRSGTDQKSKDEPPDKKTRLNVTLPESSVDPSSNNSPTSESDMHTKIKITPPKPKSTFMDSSLFMEALSKNSDRPPVLMKRRKKTTVPLNTGIPSSGGSNEPSTPTTPTQKSPTSPHPSPISPTTAIKNSLPTVPSFYKDTLEEKARSPSPPTLEKSVEKMDTTENMEEDKKPEEGENSEAVTNDSVPYDGEETKNEENSNDGSTSKTVEDDSGLLTAGKNKKKKKKKNLRVTWAAESDLRQYHFFDLDETERENVNRPKSFIDMKKQEAHMDRKAVETARRLVNDSMVEAIPWRRPPPIDGLINSVDTGSLSTEKQIQRDRETSVLQAIFFTKEMLPDGPSEPDLESVEPVDPKFIPLEDENGSSEEISHTYDSVPATAQDVSAPTSLPSQVSSLLGQLNITPDIANILQSFQQGGTLPPNLDPATAQTMLASIMGTSGDPQKSEETFEKLKNILEPLQGMQNNPGMANMPPGMGPFCPPGGPMDGFNMGPGAPRFPIPPGLLGSAPPGFNPMMGPPPNGPPPRFGPGGPGPRPGIGDQEEWGDNMMGGPQAMRGRGRGGMPMRGGRMPPPGGPRGPPPNMMRGGRGGRGGRQGGERAVCRHFAAGGCRRGNTCSFLHPGVNGPPV